MKTRDAARDEVISPALSKRGARRVIQRAFVLVGRERAIRQHLREVHLTTLWVLEDWGLEWTVVLDRGRLEFHRGHVGRPEVTYAWRTAEEFFSQVDTGKAMQDSFQFVGEATWRRVLEPVLSAFVKSLSAVLANPIDDDGERLL